MSVFLLYCHLHALGEEDLLGHALLDDLLEVLVLLVLLPQPHVLLLEGADLQHSTVQCSAVQYSTKQNSADLPEQGHQHQRHHDQGDGQQGNIPQIPAHAQRGNHVYIGHWHWEACALRRSPGPRPPLLGGVGQHGLGGQHGQPAGPRLLGPEDVADLDHGRTPDTRLSLGRQSTSQ